MQIGFFPTIPPIRLRLFPTILARHAWNHLAIRIAHKRSPPALYLLSREQLMLQGVWTGDVGDDIPCVDGYYGEEGAEGAVIEILDSSGTNGSLNRDADSVGEVSVLLAWEDFDFEADSGKVIGAVLLVVAHVSTEE
ncbi:hypothetical protein BDZ89DRAFT_1146339 [Hymenopellis radicata]|nr:hypothetical protein BDZ89DRAFT_1146339 [Hymenopellis radicata]